uniref:Calcium channel, voltage-dependent, alpha 2/delta subunit 1a n=1 Tax=Gasterosteus aculeatus aculeatus TaxID=481459 RepID=A0AAQ4P6Z6_GASAC
KAAHTHFQFDLTVLMLQCQSEACYHVSVVWLIDFFVCFCFLRIKEWVDQMQKELITLTDTASGLENLIQVSIQTKCFVETNNPAQLVATAAGNIEKLLANRSHALRVSLKHFLMSARVSCGRRALNQTEDGKGRKNKYLPDDFEIDPDFKRPVSYNTTAVHIPTDIYEGSTIILNELNWTEALEDVFRKNKEEDPSILWQVFGSATGLARYFPGELLQSPIRLLGSGRKIPPKRYIQGAASPKDMLILVDASGSVSGLTLKLIRTSVSKMLETLSDDDYVNVVYFNDKAEHAACFRNLVQANVRNKRMLKDAVQSITAKGITNYRGGFEMAFEQLAQMNVSRANCNKIIMLFTDGGEERAEEIFKKYNPKQVRIFTFSVGQHNYDKGPIQWMACANKGYYYEIPSIGAIRINTQEYLDVLGRPMVKADRRAKQVQWTNVYLDALGLGLVITGTVPVFNKTNTGSKKSQNQLILGVMAIDVSLEDIKRLTPRFTFGPNGYYFAIDANGYVLLHPNLQPRVRPTFDEPVTLDFLDAELENEIKVEVWKRDYSNKYTLSSHCARVCVCVFSSLALVLPDYSMHYIRAKIADTITQAKCKFSTACSGFSTRNNALVSHRMYCKDLKLPDKNQNNTEFLMEFNDYIDTKTPNNPMCNVELVNRLLLDAGITSSLIKHWKTTESQHGVLARFVATDGGITRVYPKSAGQYWEKEAETYESSYYKRSLDNDLYIFTPTPYLSKENSSEDSVLVSKAVNLKVDGIPLKPAGKDTHTHTHIYTFTYLYSTFLKLSLCLPPTYKHIPTYHCVILDDGGFLVMSNRDEHIDEIGRFFGGIDPILMVNLVNSSLFTFKKTFNYQSLCHPEKESKAAAGLRSVYVVNIFHPWLFARRSIMQQLLVSITFPNFLDAAEMDDEPSDAKGQEVCIKEQTQYYFENNVTSFGGTIDCENCTRLYHAEKLPKTNLVFIIADAKVTCSSCDTKPLIQEEQQSNGPDPCDMAKNPRYRKGPAACFDNNEHVSSFPIARRLLLADPLERQMLLLLNTIFNQNNKC